MLWGWLRTALIVVMLVRGFGFFCLSLCVILMQWWALHMMLFVWLLITCLIIRLWRDCVCLLWFDCLLCFAWC